MSIEIFKQPLHTVSKFLNIEILFVRVPFLILELPILT